MSRDYQCPTCQAVLNPGQSIVLVASHGDTRALIGFHPQPGDYEVDMPTGVHAEAGSRWDFACPVCHASLRTDESPDLCRLRMVNDGALSMILFSRVAGEQATFVMHDDRVEQHGADALVYGPLLGQMKYIRY